MTPRSRSSLLAGATVVVALAATGCSSGTHQPQVASVATIAASGGSASAGSPSTSASSAGATSSRPRERLDATASQLQAVEAPWNQCLTAHGAGRKDKPTQAVETAAQAACAHLQPLPPWQYDPANPQAMGFVEQVVACLHQHGVKYAQVQNPPGQGRIEIALGGPQNDSASVGAGLELIPTCDQQVLRENASYSTSP